MDYQQRAAGEKPEDFATEQERRDYWIDRCFDIVNGVRAEYGQAPVVRMRRQLGLIK